MEMIMVVVIILILAAIALPKFGLLLGVRQEASVKKIISDIQHAREQSLATQTRHSLYFNVSENLYQVQARINPVPSAPPYFSTIADPLNPDDLYEVNMSVSFPEIYLSSADFAGLPRLEFDAVGAPWGVNEAGKAASLTEDGLIKLASGGAEITIRVAPVNGRVYIR